MQSLTIGRAVFAIPMAIFGLMHLMSGNDMAGMVPIPGGVIWVYLIGVALIAAAVSIIINKHSKLACQLLALLLLIFALTIHLPALLEATAETMAGPMSNMLKDIALAGAAFGFSATFEEKKE